MAAHRGCDGIVKVGATPTTVAEVREWELNITGEVIDTSVMGSCSPRKLVGSTDWNGSLTCFWDPADQASLVVGSSIEIELYPIGDDTGNTYYTGTAIITEENPSGGYEGAVQTTITFEGSSTLSKTTVS